MIYYNHKARAKEAQHEKTKILEQVHGRYDDELKNSERFQILGKIKKPRIEMRTRKLELIRLYRNRKNHNIKRILHNQGDKKMTKICADVVSGVYTVSENDTEWKTAYIFSDVNDFIDYALKYCKEEEIIGFGKIK